jgi:hypothetical protein
VILFFQYFKRDADELESWIYEKLQAASDESYKDPTNLQVRTEFFFCSLHSLGSVGW